MAPTYQSRLKKKPKMNLQKRYEEALQRLLHQRGEDNKRYTFQKEELKKERPGTVAGWETNRIGPARQNKQLQPWVNNMKRLQRQENERRIQNVMFESLVFLGP